MDSLLSSQPAFPASRGPPPPGPHEPSKVHTFRTDSASPYHNSSAAALFPWASGTTLASQVLSFPGDQARPSRPSWAPSSSHLTVWTSGSCGSPGSLQWLPDHSTSSQLCPVVSNPHPLEFLKMQMRTCHYPPSKTSSGSAPAKSKCLAWHSGLRGLSPLSSDHLPRYTLYPS